MLSFRSQEENFVGWKVKCIYFARNWYIVIELKMQNCMLGKRSYRTRKYRGARVIYRLQPLLPNFFFIRVCVFQHRLHFRVT